MRAMWKSGISVLVLSLIALPAWGQQDYQSDEDARSSRSGQASRGQSRDSESDQDFESRSNRQFSQRDDRSERDRRDRSMSSRDRSSRSDRQSRNQDDGWSAGWSSESNIQERGVLRATEVIGMEVKNGQGESLGEVEDIVIDLNQKDLRYAAISYGGLLGVGTKLFAVPLDSLQLRQDQDGNRFMIFNVDQEDLEHSDGFENAQRWPAQAQSQWAQAGQRSGSQTASGRSGQSRSFEAKFYDYGDDRLVVRDNQGRRLTYEVAPGVRVTQDGQRTFFDELDEGDQLRIRYNQQGEQGSTLITAVEVMSQQDEGVASTSRSSRSGMASRSESQTRTISGRVQQVEDQDLAIRTSSGKTEWVRVDDNAQISVDGDDSYEISDLEQGQQVTIRARDRQGELTAMSIEADSDRRR